LIENYVNNALSSFSSFGYFLLYLLAKGEIKMLNQLVVVGRLVRDPELRQTENGRNVTNITLAVPRSYKNVNGEYETDFIDCVLWSGVAESTTEYCKKGDLLGVKGRVQTRRIETEDEKIKQVTEVVAEKVTFLSNGNNRGKGQD
jgi:single-stranded DNA-binding protein